MAAQFQVFGQDRDQGDTQGAARDQGGKQVGDVVGGVEHIDIVGQAELACHQNLSDEPQAFVDSEEYGDNQG